MTLAVIAKVTQIILLNIVLSGDNAVVIGMVARSLPGDQRRRAIFWGGAVAVLLRIVFTLAMTVLLMLPGVRFVGGLMLAWIACKLLRDEDEQQVGANRASSNVWGAIRLIFLADFVMSLDNILAIAGAAGDESWHLLLFGLVVSIGIIMFFSTLIARLMNRFRIVVYLGVAILAWTSAEMMIGDRELAHYFAGSHRISLDRHWEHDFMVTEGEVADFINSENLPVALADFVKYQPPGRLQFIGQMSSEQRDLLLAHVATEVDKAAIRTMYETAHRRDVPDWVPTSLRSRIEAWFQRRWPVEIWQGVQGQNYHFVAWIWCGCVLVFCLTSPWWWRRREEDSEADRGDQRLLAQTTG